MPVTLVDRLPLPNLKVYTAGSVLLLSVSMYYALSVTGDPDWRVNATQRVEQSPAEGSDAARMMQPVSLEELAPGALNRTRNMTDHVAEVFAFMMQEPLCMWTVINMSYCALALVGVAIQRLVFGKLRVSEAQRVKDKFWNYVFYKFIFVFGVVNVQYMDEVLLWCSWFTVLGFLQLLAQLCKDRFDYLSFSPATSAWAHVRLMALLSGIIGCSAGLLAAAAVYGLPAGRDTFAFMSAECILVFLCASHVAARYILQAAEADAAGPIVYYTHLVFDTLSLSIEVMHVVHMVVWSNMVVSMASLVLLMQLRHLLHALQARLRRHRQYTAVNTHMDRNYPMASKEEVEANSDNCAICWEPMKEARRLPCTHLFHNSCLSQWLQQDASCPTCRRGLSAARTPHAPHVAPIPAPPPPPLRAPNHLFHFDGSRYVSWLPSFSVEVTRVRLEPPPTSQIDAMARQVQSMFPHFPLGVLAADLVATRAVELTVDNILEGRLSPPPAPPTPPHTPPHNPETPSTSAHVPAETHAHIDTHAHTDEPTHDAAGTSTDDTWLSHDDHLSGEFGASSGERESVLRRRKEHLVQSARRRYLARSAAAAPHPAHSS